MPRLTLPLRHKAFRNLWASGLISAVGTWMHEVAEAWLMTTLTSSALLVSLVQSVDALPVLFLALPAGAMADIVDRRKLLLFTQTWMLASAALLGFLTMAGLTTPALLLACTLLLGVGAAMNVPVWQAAVPELVAKEDLPAAIMLHGVSMNFARVVGPALGGALVAAAGSGPVFLINSASFLVVLAALVAWRPAKTAPQGPPERIVGAVAAGLRFARHSPELLSVFARTALFAVPASALWSLLPLLAKRELGAGPAQYGLMIGCVGAGAILGALVMIKARDRLGSQRLVVASSAVFAAALAGLSRSGSMLWAAPTLVALGVGWIAILSTLNYAAQSVAPSWVRGRAMAIYVMVLQGGMAGGSAVWGACAQRYGVRAAIFAAAVTLAAGLFGAWRWRLAEGVRLDLRPSANWSEPEAAALPPDHEAGPVVVTVEFHVKPEDVAEFTRRMYARRLSRRRDGAYEWGLFRDAALPGRYLEIFMVESWAEHLRQHRRATVQDDLDREELLGLHASESSPVVRHLVSVAPAEGPGPT